MPPTFFLFIGFLVYLGATAITLGVFVPMLLFDSKRLIAKKVIATVLISFPCLIAMIIFWTIIFAIPALAFSGLANIGIIPETSGIFFTIIGIFVFAGSIVISSLYLWYFTSQIIYKKLDKKPIADFFDNDKVFKFLRRYLVKFKLYHPIS